MASGDMDTSETERMLNSAERGHFDMLKWWWHKGELTKIEQGVNVSESWESFLERNKDTHIEFDDQRSPPDPPKNWHFHGPLYNGVHSPIAKRGDISTPILDWLPNRRLRASHP